MKKIIILMFIIILGLTACKDETQKDNQIVENNKEDERNDSTQTGEENTDGGLEEGEVDITDNNADGNNNANGNNNADGNNNANGNNNADGNGEDEESNPPPEVYATPIATGLTPEFSFYVEKEEIKAVEYIHNVAGSCSYRGVEYTFAFEWVRVGDTIKTRRVDLPEGMVRPEVWYTDYIIGISKTSNKSIFQLIGMDENSDTFFYYAYLDLDTGAISMIGEKDFWNCHHVVNMFYGENMEQLMFVTEEEIFYFDGNTMKPVSDTIAAAGMQIGGGESVRIAVLENEAVISEIRSGTDGEKYLSACTYNLSTGEVKCTIDRLDISGVEEYNESYLFDCLFATYCENENLKIINLATGQIKNGEVNKAKQILFCKGRYFLFVQENGTETTVVAYDAHSGRVVDKITIEGQNGSYQHVSLVDSDEGIYIRYSTSIRDEIYKLNVETE